MFRFPMKNYSFSEKMRKSPAIILRHGYEWKGPELIMIAAAYYIMCMFELLLNCCCSNTNKYSDTARSALDKKTPVSKDSHSEISKFLERMYDPYIHPWPAVKSRPAISTHHCLNLCHRVLSEQNRKWPSWNPSAFLKKSVKLKPNLHTLDRNVWRKRQK